MSGQELKAKLQTSGYTISKIAELMGMSQPNFSAMLKVADVKTGTLEKLCTVLGVNMSFFYPNNNLTSINVGQQHGTNVNTGGTQTVTGVSMETLTTLIEASAEKDKQINMLLQKLSGK